MKRDGHEPIVSNQVPEPFDEELWKEYLREHHLTLQDVRLANGEPCPCYGCNANRRFFWQWMEDRGK